ncbi:MAG: sugar kinase [Clostridia bacterium]|nr:sugar kinase [Clostridia bacterium]
MCAESASAQKPRGNGEGEEENGGRPQNPQGAGNVACNVAALKPKKVCAIGMTGKDWRGAALRELLTDAGIDVSMFLASPRRVTPAYIKPLRTGLTDVIYEDPRLDFEDRKPMEPEDEKALIETLDKLDVDVLCVGDQLKFGCITPAVRKKICDMSRSGLTVIVDSRDRIALYEDVIVKPNEVEAARAVQTEGEYADIAKLLSKKTRRPAIVTLGGEGCLVCENGIVTAVPARKKEPPIDICGAGDTFMSAFACAIAAGASLTEAAWFANTASSITIKKINMTGVATREEMQAAW